MPNLVIICYKVHEMKHADGWIRCPLHAFPCELRVNSAQKLSTLNNFVSRFRLQNLWSFLGLFVLENTAFSDARLCSLAGTYNVSEEDAALTFMVECAEYEDYGRLGCDTV
jgi:hypothetical protein